jgi:aspartate/methionine/tyrosine aminotransferase
MKGQRAAGSRQLAAGRAVLKVAREFRHLTWLEAHKGARYNLGSSSVLTLRFEDVGPFDPAQQVGAAYPGGDPELVELISRAYGVEDDSVLITNGAGEANALAAMVCVEKGSEVLIERPVYQSLVEVSRFLGAKAIHFDRRLRHGFDIDLEGLKDKISRRCRLVILSNLHNPSCAMVGEQKLASIAEVAADIGATVLCDEVYLDCAGEAAPPPMAALAENAVSTNSLSKAYGAGGFRMGWMLAAPAILRAVKRLRDHISIAPNRLGEEAAKNLLKRRDAILSRTIDITRRNTAEMDRWVASRDDVEWFKPPAGTVCFPRILKRTPTIEIARRLFDRESTLVCPGEFFQVPGHFRIGLGGSTEMMRPGLEALGRVLDDVV